MVTIVKDKELSKKEIVKQILDWYKNNTRMLVFHYSDGDQYCIQVQEGKDNWVSLSWCHGEKFKALEEFRKIIAEEIRVKTNYLLPEPEPICDCFWKEFEK